LLLRREFIGFLNGGCIHPKSSYSFSPLRFFRCPFSPLSIFVRLLFRREFIGCLNGGCIHPKSTIYLFSPFSPLRFFCRLTIPFSPSLKQDENLLILACCPLLGSKCTPPGDDAPGSRPNSNPNSCPHPDARWGALFANCKSRTGDGGGGGKAMLGSRTELTILCSLLPT
jgi:hypothetical protein